MSYQTTKPLVQPGLLLPSKIRVSLYSGRTGADAAESEGSLSPWLYLGGLCATMCAVYAVSYGIEDSNYGFMLYVLAVCGFATSYFLRLRGISLQNFQIPLFVCLGLIFYVGVSSGLGISLSSTEGMPDRTRVIQVALVWFVVLLSFVLQNDSAVLFTCVPCLTILALVSSANTDIEIQTAFMSFICCATFLLVHENSLRTRKSLMSGSPQQGGVRQFVWQLALVGVCFTTASLLASLIAAPIHQLVPNFWVNTGMDNNPAKPFNVGQQNIRVEERSSIELATGAVSSSALPLLSVRSEMPELLWRGATFDFYTGHRFTNNIGTSSRIEPLPQTNNAVLRNIIIDPNDGSQRTSLFHISTAIYELSSRQMQGSHRVIQKVDILAGSFSQFYGAGNIEDIKTSIPYIFTNPSSGIMTTIPLRNGSSYAVSSNVVTSDPNILRAASNVIPAEIGRMYLQKAPEGGQESALLRALAREITRGKTSNYEKALAIQEAIGNRCKYNLQSPAAPPDRDCVEYFLFDAKQGYCDSFGAAMTMLCRYAGVPARLASGFLTGEKQPDGSYTVREKDKHVWAEVYFPNTGWVPFDATAGAVDISDYSEHGGKRRLNLLSWITSHGVFPPLAALLVLILLCYVGKVEIWDRWARRSSYVTEVTMYPPTNRIVVDAYMQACVILARKGLERPASATPAEFLQQLGTQSQIPSDLLGSFQTLTGMHARFRYGTEIASDEDTRTAVKSVEALKTAFAGRKPRELALISS